MKKCESVSALRFLRPLLLTAFVTTSAACEPPLNVIVSATSIPSDSDGIEFMVRTIADPMGGREAVQTAADTPVQRLSFTSAPPTQGSAAYTFGLYLPDLKSGKVQVNVAAIKNGCPIATGSNEITPPLSMQRLTVDLRPALGRGSADPEKGCPLGKPQIFAVLRSSIQVNAQPANLQVGLVGWGYYPGSLVQLAFSPIATPDPPFMLRTPTPFSSNASELHATYAPGDVPVPISELEKAFDGVGSVKVTVLNPDGQSAAVLLADLK
jgi:hypothetical protein